MTKPTNMSLDGITTWAEGAGNPPADGQNINADTVDGKHFSDLQDLWQTYTDIHGGALAFGTSAFGGAGVPKYVPLGSGIVATTTTYAVILTPGSISGYVGDWKVYDKGLNGFWVGNTGSGTDAFDWAVLGA